MVDGGTGFVGSFNLDPRSRSINTEMGILFQSPSLVRQLLAFSRRQTLDPQPTDANKLVSNMSELLRRTLAGYASHPNFAGVLVVGLGCETNQIDQWLDNEGLQAGARLQTLNIQDAGGTAKAVARGIDAVRALLPLYNAVDRWIFTLPPLAPFSPFVLTAGEKRKGPG